MSNYFEDLEIDSLAVLGSHTFGRTEIIDFARKYDPQPFHLDDEAARNGLFGGLAASGWHTSAVGVRLLIDYRQREAALITLRGDRPARYGPSPGFENLKWLKPVLAGDTLTYAARVIQKVDSRSRPEVGLVYTQSEATNQRGEPAFSVVTKVFVERRTPATA